MAHQRYNKGSMTLTYLLRLGSFYVFFTINKTCYVFLLYSLSLFALRGSLTLAPSPVCCVCSDRVGEGEATSSGEGTGMGAEGRG